MLLFKNFFFFFSRVYLTPSLEDRQKIRVRFFSFFLKKGVDLYNFRFVWLVKKKTWKQFAFLLTDVTLFEVMPEQLYLHILRNCVLTLREMGWLGSHHPLFLFNDMHQNWYKIKKEKNLKKSRQFLFIYSDDDGDGWSHTKGFFFYLKIKSCIISLPPLPTKESNPLNYKGWVVVIQTLVCNDNLVV